MSMSLNSIDHISSHRRRELIMDECTSFSYEYVFSFEVHFSLYFAHSEYIYERYTRIGYILGPKVWLQYCTVAFFPVFFLAHGSFEFFRVGGETRDNITSTHIGLIIETQCEWIEHRIGYTMIPGSNFPILIWLSDNRYGESPLIGRMGIYDSPWSISVDRSRKTRTINHSS